jgi:SAM-dependent methyltransferase
MTTTTAIDEAKAQAFAGQMVGFLNGAAVAMMASIGHRTGLFDKLAMLPPSTSAEIAEAAGLNERYVREWLGTMTTARVVNYDPGTRKYSLPPEHAGSLTRAAGPGNLANMSQFFSLFGAVEDHIVESFLKGGGVPYSMFPKFQALMAEMSGQVFDATLTGMTLNLAPGLVERLKAGIEVADVGCGSGHAINLMAKEFPNSRFVGYDFSEAAIAAGRSEAAEMGLKNARFEVKDIATLDASEKFDLVTAFDTIHDQAQPRRVLKGIADSLKPDGTFLCVDVAASSEVHENIEHPLGPAGYMISTFHCMTVSLALGGEGLGTMWGEQKAIELMSEAGFKDIDVKQVEGDFMNNYYIAKK